MRPLLLETNFKNPLLAPFGWLLRAINMPDIIRASAEDGGAPRKPSPR